LAKLFLNGRIFSLKYYYLQMNKIYKLVMTLLLVAVPMFLLKGTPAFATDVDLEISDYSYDSWNLDDYDTTYSWDLDDEQAFQIFSTIAKWGSFFIGVSTLLGLASYVYMSLALSTIGEKLGYENKWFAWIPILNMVMLFELGDQNPLFLLLLLIPGLGALALMIMSIIAIMNITEKRGFDKNLGLLCLVPIVNLVLLGYIAWKDPK
jgi:hypothetical protein